VLKYENNLSEILRMFQLAYEAIMQGYAQGNRGLVDYLSSFKDSVIGNMCEFLYIIRYIFYALWRNNSIIIGRSNKLGH